MPESTPKFKVNDIVLLDPQLSSTLRQNRDPNRKTAKVRILEVLPPDEDIDQPHYLVLAVMIIPIEVREEIGLEYWQIRKPFSVLESELSQPH